jgi:hypothetical protein
MLIQEKGSAQSMETFIVGMPPAQNRFQTLMEIGFWKLFPAFAASQNFLRSDGVGPQPGAHLEDRGYWQKFHVIFAATVEKLTSARSRLRPKACSSYGFEHSPVMSLVDSL